MLSTENNPWLGLESYSINDAYRFYGRDRDIELVSNAIYDNFITTIYGISGAGKTSLLNAGLTPALISENYLPIRVRLFHNTDKSYSTQIIEAVSNAIESIGGEVEYEGAISLDKVVEQEKLWFFLHTRRFWSKHNYSIRPVIFIDQFEELFTKNDDACKISLFFEMINAIQYDTPPSNTKDLLENGTDYFELECNTSRIVFVIREDFLARLEDYSYGIAALRRNRIGIKQMNGHQALEVILNPNPSLITREGALKILSKVSGKEVIDSDRSLGRLSVDTSILSLFCSELYQRAVEENSDTITTNIIEEFGSNIISHFYTKCMSQVPSSLVTYLEKHLLTSNGFRNSIALEDIEMPKFTKESINNSLLLLSDKRIIRIEDTNGVERVEFTHDVLCKVAKQHRDNIYKAKELKKNRWLSVLKSLDFLIILFLSYLSLKNGDYYINGQVATLRLIGPKAIAIGLLFYYSFLYKRCLASTRTKLVSSIVLGIMLMDLPDVLHRSYGMKFIDYIVDIAIPSLTIVLSFFAFNKDGRVNKKQFLALSIIDSLLIVLEYSHSISGLLILFSFFILLPYRYSNDKKAYIFAVLGSFINLIYYLINDRNASWYPLLPVVCVLYPLTTFIFKPKENTRTFKSSLTSCLTLEVYQSHTYLKVILYLLGILILFARSIKYGDSMYEYNILYSSCVAGLFFVLLANIFKSISSKFYDFIDKNTDLCFWGGLMSSIITLAIFCCLYIPYGFLIIVLIWAFIGVALLKQYKMNASQDKKFFIPFVIISFLSIVCIPLNCIGYNVASHIQYRRVPGSINIAHTSDLSNEFIIIKDVNGNYGVRDRYNIIVPVEFKKIIGAVSYGIDTDYKRGIFSYDCGSANYYEGKYFPRYNTFSRRLSRWRNCYDGHSANASANIIGSGNLSSDISESPYINETNIPNIIFTLMQGADSVVVWECNEHLNNTNLCTSLIMNTVETRLSQIADIPYALDYLSLLSKAKLNTSTLSRNLIETCIKRLLGTVNYTSGGISTIDINEDVSLLPFSDAIKNHIGNLTLSEVESFLDESHKLLAYVNDTSFVKFIVDTLYAQRLPKDLSAAERLQHYNNISKLYLYGKTPEMADKYASRSIQIDTMMKYSYLRKVEAYILSKKYDEAETLIRKYGIDVNYEGPLWEGILKQAQLNADTVSFKKQYNFRGSLADDLNEFESIGLIESPYDEAYLHVLNNIEPKNDLYNSSEIKGEYKLCKKYHSYDGPIGEHYKSYKLEYQYYMSDGEQISPCYKTYAEGIDENILLVIDEFSHKRVFINMTGRIPTVIQGEYDHAWRFSEGLAAVSNNGKLGFIDKFGVFVIDTTFTYANNLKYYVDNYNRQQTHFVDFTFHRNLCPMVDDNGKYGLINKDGDWILTAEYDDIKFLQPFNIWLLKVYKDNLVSYGAVNNDGKVTVPAVYEHFITINNNKACWGNGDNYSVLDIGTNNLVNNYIVKCVRDEFTGQSEWLLTYPTGEIEKYSDSIVDSTWDSSSCH